MKKIIFDKYIKEVCYLYRITQEDFFTKLKRKDIANARYLLIYLCSERNMAQVEIINYFAEYGYTIQRSTIIHAINTVKGLVETDNDTYTIAKRIEESTTI